MDGMFQDPEPVWLRERRDMKEKDDDLSMVSDAAGVQKFGTQDGIYHISRDWGDQRESTITKDYAFNRHSINDGEHVSPFDNARVQIGSDGIDVALVQGIDEASFRRTLSAATRATIGIDIETRWEHCPEWENNTTSDCKLSEDAKHRWLPNGRAEHLIDPLNQNEDWEEMLKGGLQTALETQVIVFAVKGASRTATHQLVRSRRAAFHQQSQRASYMGDFPECRMPESVWVKPRARDAFIKALIEAHAAYRTICEEDVSYQDARFILPEGTCNFILLEYPVREFINVYAYRACSMFQWEIVSIIRKCRDALVAKHSWIAPYVKISCQSGPCPQCGGKGKIMLDDDHSGSVACVTCIGTGMVGNKCTFQGWENVEGQCDFSWAKEENRTFKPAFHKIERRPS